MNSNIQALPAQTLPDPLPVNPLTLAQEWLAQAQRDAAQPNPDSMVLATVDASGQPSARVVLCKGIEPEPGIITFVTHYQSRKGRELAANPRAALVFHWDHHHRQVRAEGRVQPLSEAENDAYFRTRPLLSRVGAWASQQSAPLPSGRTLIQQVIEAARRFGVPYGGPGTPEPADVDIDIPRPPYWGGFSLRVDAMELWVEGAYRIHDRARWTRSPVSGQVRGDGWSAMRLQP